MKTEIFYRNWRITYNPKPIPIRNHDFDAVHVDYDGPPDSRYFTAISVSAAKNAIDDFEEE